MADKLRIKVLGGFEARLGDGGALVLKSRKTQALLAVLALSAGTPLAREKLTWPAVERARARNRPAPRPRSFARSAGPRTTTSASTRRPTHGSACATWKTPSTRLEGYREAGLLE